KTREELARKEVITALSSGGIIKGPGGPTDDKILIRASAGEAVIAESAVRFYGGESFVDKLNKRELKFTQESESAVRRDQVSSVTGRRSFTSQDATVQAAE